MEIRLPLGIATLIKRRECFDMRLLLWRGGAWADWAAVRRWCTIPRWLSRDNAFDVPNIFLSPERGRVSPLEIHLEIANRDGKKGTRHLKD